MDDVNQYLEKLNLIMNVINDCEKGLKDIDSLLKTEYVKMD